jgi:hypothetical protein
MIAPVVTFDSINLIYNVTFVQPNAGGNNVIITAYEINI